MPLNIEGYKIRDQDVRMYEQTNIVRSGLVLHVDHSIFKTVGFSDTVYDLSGNGVGSVTGASINSSKDIISFSLGDRIGFGEDGGSLSVNPGSENELSVCAWIKPQPSGDDRAPITRIDRWYFQVYDQNNLATYWYGRNPAGYHYSTSNSIPMNQWSFASVVWSTNDIKFYINSNLNTTINSVLGTGDQNNWIKIGHEHDGRRYDGDMGQVFVYNRELSATEIAHNYNVTKGRFGL